MYYLWYSHIFSVYLGVAAFTIVLVQRWHHHVPTARGVLIVEFAHKGSILNVARPLLEVRKYRKTQGSRQGVSLKQEPWQPDSPVRG